MNTAKFDSGFKVGDFVEVDNYPYAGVVKGTVTKVEGVYIWLDDDPAPYHTASAYLLNNVITQGGVTSALPAPVFNPVLITADAPRLNAEIDMHDDPEREAAWQKRIADYKASVQVAPDVPDNLQAKLERYEDALTWYADDANYVEPYHYELDVYRDAPVATDRGERARKALATAPADAAEGAE